MQDLSSALANLGTTVTITYAATNVHASAVRAERHCKVKSIQNKLGLCQHSTLRAVPSERGILWK
jgi:hypothetical protein